MNHPPRRKHLAMLALAGIALVVVPRTAAAGNWSAANVSELVEAMDKANQTGGANTIILARHATFTLTAVNNTADGPTGLPVIAAKDNLTILGNGATLARSAAPGTPAFRLFDVSPGAALTLQNLTLANGLVIGDTGEDARGGAILNAAGASLTVKYSTFVGNQAIGGDCHRQLGGFGLGGAIWNDGTADLDDVTFSGNQAVGGATRNANVKWLGGAAFGGAVSSGNSGTLTVGNCSFIGNKAIGGRRLFHCGWGEAIGCSGAIDNWGIAVITDSTFTDNQAIGGTADPGVDGGFSVGGAIGSGGPYALSPVCTIGRCAFRHNLAIGSNAGSPDNFNSEGIGGALSNGFSQGAATMTIADCSFTDNQALGGDGGIGGSGSAGAINLEAPLSLAVALTTIARSTFTDNKAVGRGMGGSGYGGAIGTMDANADGGSGATLEISDCTFSGNEALAAPGGYPYGSWSFGWSGAVDSRGNTTILSSVFKGNRAIGGALQAGAWSSFGSCASGGGLSSWGGSLVIRDSSFVGNQAIGGDASLGGIPTVAMGGGITVYSGLPATIADCSLLYNTAVGGAGGSGTPGAAGVGGGLNVGLWPSYMAGLTGPNTALTVAGTTISENQAIGGAGGGQGLGGGYAVGSCMIFGRPDTSSVMLDGGSVVSQNQPDDAYHF